MCEATSIIMIGTAFVGAWSQNQQGKAAKANADINAGRIEQQGADALYRGTGEAGRVKLDTAKLLARQRVIGAGAGVDVGSASLARAGEDAAFMGAIDAEIVKNNAAREAYGYRAQADNVRRGGQAALFAGRVGATSTLLTGAANSWGAYRQANPRQPRQPKYKTVYHRSSGGPQ